MLVQLAAVVADTIFGLPRSIISRSSSRATRMPESETSATSARHSRVQSSMLEEAVITFEPSRCKSLANKIALSFRLIHVSAS